MHLNNNHAEDFFASAISLLAGTLMLVGIAWLAITWGTVDHTFEKLLSAGWIAPILFLLGAVVSKAQRVSLST